MAELPAYVTDAAICRLLAGGPWPTAAIAGRLAMPERTARHRLSQLRRAGIVVTGTDGLHLLAAPAVPDLAVATGDLAAPAVARDHGLRQAPANSGAERAPAVPDLAASAGDLAAAAVARDRPASDMPSGEDGGRWVVMAVLAVVGIGLAAAAVARRSQPHPPPAPRSPDGYEGGWYPGPAW